MSILEAKRYVNGNTELDNGAKSHLKSLLDSGVIQPSSILPNANADEMRDILDRFPNAMSGKYSPINLNLNIYMFTYLALSV